MNKAILAILFFLGFMFAGLSYTKAEVPAYVCSSNTKYDPGQVVRCGLLPNFCKGCDLYNEVVNCTANQEGFLPATIDKNTCTYVEDLPHEQKSPECAEKPSCKPPPSSCPFIDCVDKNGSNPPITGAGGSCTYPGATDPKIPGCTALCPDGSKVPGSVVSVCQRDNCYYNSCQCWPNAPCPAPVQAPVSCPVPPAVTNVRVECPYCL